MNQKRMGEAFILGALICAGLALLGYFVAGGIVSFRQLDRTVTAKGLSERDVTADIAIWPIRFDLAGDDLDALAAELEEKSGAVRQFLVAQGFTAGEITTAAPALIDRQAQRYGAQQPNSFRYQGSVTITVYSQQIGAVRQTMTRVVELVKKGIVVGGQEFDTQPQFIFTGLNEIKPGMIEEATRNAREVAEKFAHDSASNLGKIKTARQGQFSINNRDSNTPHIKKVRVVATLEYYLTD